MYRCVTNNVRSSLVNKYTVQQLIVWVRGWLHVWEYGGPNWKLGGPVLKRFRIEILGYTMPNRGVLDAWRWELHAARGIFSKNLALFEKSWFLHVLGRFCMRALWRGFDWKMLIFGPWSQFLAGSSHAAAIFSKSAKDWLLIIRFLDSWLYGASAGYRVGLSNLIPEILGYTDPISNNWVYFKAVCQVVWWLYGAKSYGKI